MASIRILSAPLNGTILSQPSKSMAHRAIICAALSKGENRIDNIVLSDDIEATLGAIRTLGASATTEDSSRYIGRKKITVRSEGNVALKAKVIDCGESGSTARFIMPITRLSTETIILTGHGRLIERPFTIFKNLFKEKGVDFYDNDGRMPITLSGKLASGEYKLPGDVSSQFVSGLLFTLPLLESRSEIIITNKLESLPYVQMTLQVLNDFGIRIIAGSDFQYFSIPGGQSYKSVPNYVVEGDWSQAAFYCVVGALSGNMVLKGLRLDSLQGDKVILEILHDMGAEFYADSSGIEFKKSSLTGIDIDVSQCPDLVPAIAVAASLAEGTTNIKNAARLRIKESDRLSTTCRELNALGAKIEEKPDGLIIHGVPELTGGQTNGSGDHRIVMALAAASTACSGMIEIEGSDSVNKSYPDFWEDFKAIGGRIEII